MAAARVWEALAQVRTVHPLVRWLPINKLHLTLVFLGQTDASRVPLLAESVASVAARHECFDVATGDAGGRIGGRRGGVAWLRLAHGGHEVAQLSLDLDDALGSATYNDTVAPRPHLTVARHVTEACLADLRTVAAQVTLGWTVNQIVLFRSHTNPKGSIYEQLTSEPLSA
jgi:2'-5' RNA ligase